MPDTINPLIGITSYGRDDMGRFSLPAAYVDCVRRAGGVPVLLPPGEARLLDLVAPLDGVILAGGGDVDPALYGGGRHGTLYMVEPERDRTEIDLVRDSLKTHRPTWGICRGSQVINVALGGTLIPHLPDAVGEKVKHRIKPGEATRHSLKLESGKLLDILKERDFSAASSHHQAVDRPAATLKPVAWAPDGVIEAVELPGHPWLLGVQWHPEITAAQDPLQQKLFDAFVEAAARFRRKGSTHAT